MNEVTDITKKREEQAAWARQAVEADLERFNRRIAAMDGDELGDFIALVVFNSGSFDFLHKLAAVGEDIDPELAGRIKNIAETFERRAAISIVSDEE